MKYLTWAEIKLKVQEKIDIQDEVFISPAELLRYCHDAIDFCEAEIHKFNAEDRYFETTYPLELVSGLQDYQLPPNIYANKVRKIMRFKNNDYYELKRLTDTKRYFDAAALNYGGSSTDYHYMLFNDSAATKPIMRLFPRSGHTVATYSTVADGTAGSSVITVSDPTGLDRDLYVVQPGIEYGLNIPEGTRIESIVGTSVTLSTPLRNDLVTAPIKFIDQDFMFFYIRNANRPLLDADLIDIPEFSTYIVQFIMVECLKKDIGNPRLADEKERLGEILAQVHSTLSNMVIDQKDTIELDNTIHREMS